MSFETPYVETEALLAFMNEDSDRVQELIKEMLPGELDRFQGQLIDLAYLVLKERKSRALSDSSS